MSFIRATSILVLFSIIFTSAFAVSDTLVLGENTSGAEKTINNGEVYWRVVIVPYGETTTIKLQPNMYLVSSSKPPKNISPLAKKYLWGAFVVYEGTLLTYDGKEAVEIIYRYSTSADKFSTFFKL